MGPFWLFHFKFILDLLMNLYKIVYNRFKICLKLYVPFPFSIFIISRDFPYLSYFHLFTFILAKLFYAKANDEYWSFSLTLNVLPYFLWFCLPQTLPPGTIDVFSCSLNWQMLLTDLWSSWLIHRQRLEPHGWHVGVRWLLGHSFLLLFFFFFFLGGGFVSGTASCLRILLS